MTAKFPVPDKWATLAMIALFVALQAFTLNYGTRRSTTCRSSATMP